MVSRWTVSENRVKPAPCKSQRRKTRALKRARAVRAAGEEGFTLLEMLVALVVLSIGVLGYMAAQYQGIGGRAYSGAMNKAVTSGMSNLEETETIDFDQMTGGGVLYRFKNCGTPATEADFNEARAYRIDWTVEQWNAVSGNPNSFLRELKTLKAFIRWKEKGVESSAVLFTFERGQKTGDN